MRAGRVVDAGAPADLVNRHAGAATIRFSLPDRPARLLDELRRIDGVRSVDRAGARVVVRGSGRSSRTSAPPWCGGSRCLTT